MKDGQYMNILSIYTKSVFQVFESFLRAQTDLVEDDIELVLDEYMSNFITYDLQLGIYTFEDILKLFLTFSYSNIQNPAAKLLMNLMILPRKLNWL